MKKLLLTGVALTALLNGSAAAADLPARQAYKAPPLVDAAYNWSGFYVGVHAGYGIADAQGVWDSAGAVHQWSRNDLRGGLWGAQIGFNVQQGMFVWGAEADYSWARLSKDVVDGEADIQTARLRDFGTARARAGIAVQNWLFYRNRRIRLGQCARYHGERGQSGPRAQRGRNSLWRRRRGRLRRRLVAQG